MVFHVPISKVSHTPLGLSFPATMVSNSSKLTVSRLQDCSDQDFVALYEGLSPIHPLVPQKTYMRLDERPNWTVGESPSPTTVCLDGNPIGHFEYYVGPTLNISTHPVFQLDSIPFRVFMNFGWSYRFPPIGCSDCDTLINSVALKDSFPNSPACDGRKEQNNSFYHVMNKDNILIDPFPFILGVGDDQSLLIETRSEERLGTNGNQSLAIRTPKHLCFYPDNNALSGQYLGEVVFHLSENDTGALVFFLMFLGIGFPIICIITTMMHCIKLRRQRLWVRSVKEYIQRLQLENELAERSLDSIE